MSEMVVGSKYVGNNDCLAKTCPDMIMTHKTGYADAVGKPEIADTV